MTAACQRGATAGGKSARATPCRRRSRRSRASRPATWRDTSVLAVTPCRRTAKNCFTPSRAACPDSLHVPAAGTLLAPAWAQVKRVEITGSAIRRVDGEGARTKATIWPRSCTRTPRRSPCGAATAGLPGGARAAGVRVCGRARHHGRPQRAGATDGAGRLHRQRPTQRPPAHAAHAARLVRPAPRGFHQPCAMPEGRPGPGPRSARVCTSAGQGAAPTSTPHFAPPCCWWRQLPCRRPA